MQRWRKKRTCFLVKPKLEFLFYHILSVTSWQHHYPFWTAVSILDWVPPESRAWPRTFMQVFLRNNLRKRLGSNISTTGLKKKPFPRGSSRVNQHCEHPGPVVEGTFEGYRMPDSPQRAPPFTPRWCTHERQMVSDFTCADFPYSCQRVLRQWRGLESATVK